MVRNVGDDPTKTYYHVVPSNISKSIADIKFSTTTDLKYEQAEVL